MKNSDDKPQYKIYKFGSRTDAQKSKRTKSASFYGWLSGLIIVGLSLIIAMGINNWQLSHQGPNTAIISKHTAKSKQTQAQLNRSTKTSDQHSTSRSVSQFREQLASYQDTGLTTKQRAKFQATINSEKDAEIAKQEQTLLDQVKVKVTSNSNQPKTNEFSQSHTFSSIDDAKNWANATKQQWLSAGYSTYTITSNGQGYYLLHFVK